MAVPQELRDKYGEEISVITKKSGPYNIHVAVKEFEDGSTRTVGIKGEQRRPALLGFDTFVDVSDLPTTFSTTDIEQVRRTISNRL